MNNSPRIFERRFDADRIESGNELLSIANGLAMIGEREDTVQWAATQRGLGLWRNG